MEEVAANIYRIAIPIPVPHLDSINAYVIIANQRNLIIDPGMYHDQCMTTIKTALDNLGVNLEKTDFFITHGHPDHFPLVSRLITDKSVIYINRREFEVIERVRSYAIFDDYAHFFEITGFPEKDPRRVVPHDAGDVYRVRESWPFRFVEDGEVLHCGKQQFRCIITPGHTTGHMCLYEEANKLLFSGDHLLGNITPAIQALSDKENPLLDYLDSLKRIHGMNIDMVLPGHRSVFRDYRGRIGQLESHHENRATEVLLALQEGSKDSYQVAAQIKWNVVDCDGWESAPPLQKFFATGEVLAHLKFLEGKKHVQKHVQGQRLFYSLTGR